MENDDHTNLWWKNIVKINNKMDKKLTQLQSAVFGTKLN